MALIQILKLKSLFLALLLLSIAFLFSFFSLSPFPLFLLSSLLSLTPLSLTVQQRLPAPSGHAYTVATTKAAAGFHPPTSSSTSCTCPDLAAHQQPLCEHSAASVRTTHRANHHHNKLSSTPFL